MTAEHILPTRQHRAFTIRIYAVLDDEPMIKSSSGNRPGGKKEVTGILDRPDTWTQLFVYTYLFIFIRIKCDRSSFSSLRSSTDALARELYAAVHKLLCRPA